MKKFKGKKNLQGEAWGLQSHEFPATLLLKPLNYKESQSTTQGNCVMNNLKLILLERLPGVGKMMRCHPGLKH